MYCDHPGCCSGCNQEAILPLTWQDAKPANEVQAKAWGEAANELLKQYARINLHAMIIGIAYNCNVRPENFPHVTLQIEKFLRESGAFELRSGKNGGVFRKDLNTIVNLDGVSKSTYPFTSRETLLREVHGTLPPVLEPIQSVTVDDYTCGCGNTKCSKTERSCWKCGAAIVK